ncbi:MAG TPA: hypothetical protein VFC44_17425 [Candidatus Saccharimonadales bacterium]|nr:hypothetical protein [Candidatus Saccharimonadales bacterium]
MIKFFPQLKNEEIAVDLMVVVLSVFLSAYLTSLLCRWAARRVSDVRWYFSLFGALAAMGFICLLIGLGFLLTGGHLPYGAVIWIYILERLPILVLTPAIIMAIYYQRKFHRNTQKKIG